MILPSEKLIFIHIPKTGGISVEDFIMKKFGYTRQSLWMTSGGGLVLDKLEYRLYPYMHFPLEEVIKTAEASKIKIDNSWEIFSIVRNPYYKFLSELFFTDTIPLKYHYHTLPINYRDKFLNDCIDDYFADKHMGLTNHSNHALPQYKFFENVDVNYKIFKFEEGLPNIMEQMGFDPVIDFPHKMDNFASYPRPKYRDILTPYLVEVVNERYHKDFETFRYNMLSPLDI